MKLKRIIFVIGVLAASLLTQCRVTQKKEDNVILQHLLTAKIIFVSDENEIGIIDQSGELHVFPGGDG